MTAIKKNIILTINRSNHIRPREVAKIIPRTNLLFILESYNLKFYYLWYSITLWESTTKSPIELIHNNNSQIHTVVSILNISGIDNFSHPKIINPAPATKWNNFSIFSEKVKKLLSK